MQKTAMNPNPEQEMTVNPFAQEQTAEIQPQENAQTYPVEVDGDIVELTLEELIDAAVQRMPKPIMQDIVWSKENEDDTESDGSSPSP